MVAMHSSADRDVPRYTTAAIETLSPEDFETASVRSAAPSYSECRPLSTPSDYQAMRKSTVVFASPDSMGGWRASPETKI